MRKPICVGDLESSRRKRQARFCYRREEEKLREARGEGSGIKSSQPRAGPDQNRCRHHRQLPHSWQ